MKLPDLLRQFAARLAEDAGEAAALDEPVESTGVTYLRTVGALHLYAVDVPPGTAFLEDAPVTIVPSGDLEPTTGVVLRHRDRTVLVQTVDALAPSSDNLAPSLDDNLAPSSDDHLVPSLDNLALVSDAAALFTRASERLAEMAAKPESYALGPAERLVPWLDPSPGDDNDAARTGVSAAVLTTVWHDDRAARLTTIGALATTLMRQNKRVLLVAPTHDDVDRVLGGLAATLHNAALPFASLLSRYETSASKEAGGRALDALSFEGQMHRFFAASRSRKHVLQDQYDRYRALVPTLGWKGRKQRDLNEVTLLEWRLLAQVSELQGKIRDIDTVLDEYQRLPVWRRLGMQTMGKNTETLAEYRTMHTGEIAGLMREVETAQARIRVLSPEAAVSRAMRTEYDTLKEAITRLGGTGKVREMLAAGEATNRQAFMQNKRLVVATPARVVTDTLFRRIRFDVLIAEDAPNIPAPFLLGVAGLIREQIILAGDTRDLHGAGKIWRQQCVETAPASLGTPSA